MGAHKPLVKVNGQYVMLDDADTLDLTLAQRGAIASIYFVDLADVPTDYTGDALKVVRVNAGETALEFATPAAGVSTFTALTDAPATYVWLRIRSVRRTLPEQPSIRFYRLPRK